MEQIILEGDPPVEIMLRRSGRARRLSLRVSKLDGRVTMTLPKGIRIAEGKRFAEAKGAWIRAALEERAAPVIVAPGVDLPVEGVLRRVVVGGGRHARLNAQEIQVPEGRTGPALLALLKHLARDRLAAAVDRYTAEVGKTAGRLTLRDTRSRWGSCTTDGNLMFSWRLILAPPSALDYVAAHEVAHLVHMDHSANFWGLVGEICPNFAEERDWMKREGSGLHRYRFE